MLEHWESHVDITKMVRQQTMVRGPRETVRVKTAREKWSNSSAEVLNAAVDLQLVDPDPTAHPASKLALPRDATSK